MVLVKQIATYLQAQAVGTLATDLFFGYLPENGTLPLVCILDTGGMPPEQDIPTNHPTFQIFVRGATFLSGKAKIDTIRGILHRKFNATLVNGESYFYYIFAQSEGGHIGRNAAGMDEFSINFEAYIR